jgi:hypothetical protein
MGLGYRFRSRLLMHHYFPELSPGLAKRPGTFLRDYERRDPIAMEASRVSALAKALNSHRSWQFLGKIPAGAFVL